MKLHIETDVAIVGAGLVGLSACIAFAHQDKSVVLVDAKKPTINLQKTWDERVCALTPATETWLKSMGVWEYLDASRISSINAMHIFDYASDQPLILRDEHANLPKLGVIIENQNLIHALWQQLEMLDVTVITDAPCQTLNNACQHVLLGLQNGQEIAAKLIIAADGVNSWVRQEANITVKQKDFHQTAIVANFVAEKHHQHIARQWFAPHDVLALLPLPGNIVSIVWSVSTEKTAQLLLLSAEALAQSVLEQTKGELGDLKLVGKAQSFALNQQTATQLIAERVVVVGDAAHQIHPMAGQGVNLGFRDVMQLSSQTTKLHKMQDVGDNGMLRQFERARKIDIATMNTLTTGLDYLFASDNDIIKKVANWGLQQLNHQASIKKLLIQQVAG